MPHATLPSDIVAELDRLVAMAVLEGHDEMTGDYAELDRAIAATHRVRLGLEAAIARHLPTAKPRIRVPYRREPEVQIVDHLGSAARRTAA